MPLFRKNKKTNLATLPILQSDILDTDEIVVIREEEVFKTSTPSIETYLRNQPSSAIVPLRWQFNGDTNGVFHYLGLINNTWVNPVAVNRVILTASSIQAGTVASLVDKSPSEFYTFPGQGNFIKIDFIGNRLKPTHYSIRTRNISDGYYPRNWKLQGSNDSITWIDLDSQTNNTTLITGNQWLTLPVNTPDAFMYLRLLSTGVDSNGANYLVLGEIEFYGDLYVSRS